MTSNMRALSNELIKVKNQLNSTQSPQLKYAAVENGGNITIREPVLDEFGNVMLNEDGVQMYRETMQIGSQFDGSYAASPVTSGQHKPPQATAPTMVPIPGGFVIKWDGEFVDSLFAPMNFSRVETHLSNEFGFSAEFSDTIVGTTSSPRASYVVVQGLDVTQTWYAKLVVRDTAGAAGPVSAESFDQPLPNADEAATQAAIEAATRAETKADQAKAEASTATQTAVGAQEAADQAQEAAEDAQATADAAGTAAEAARQRAEEAKADAIAATSAANAADQSAQDAMAQADMALTSANGKTKVTWGSGSPPVLLPQLLGPNGEIQYAVSSEEAAGRSVGDIWYTKDSARNGSIAEMWEFGPVSDGSNGWTARPLNDIAIASLTAGKLTTGTLNAATTITTGDPAGVHSQLGQGGLRVFRPGPEGDPEATVNIGGATEDTIQLIDTSNGATKAGLLSDGTVMGTVGQFDSLEIAGISVGDMYNRWDALFGAARGFDSGFQMSAGQGPATTGKQDVAELRYFSQANRWYKVSVVMNVMKQNPGLFRLQLRYSTDGSDPADYTGNTNQIYMGMFYQGYAGMHLSCQASGLLFSPDNDVRVVAFIENITGGGVINYYGDPRGRIWVEDAGPVVNGSQAWTSGAMRTTSTQTPVQTANASSKIKTVTFAPTWSRTWRDGSARTDTSDIVQGTYGGRTNRGAVGFGSEVASTLSGATILNAYLRLRSNNWYYSDGGVAVIGNHGNGSVPSSFPAGGATFTRAWSRKIGIQNVTIPNTWWDYLRTGAHRGYTFGDGASTSPTYYGRFDGATAGADKRPQLVVTYKK